MYDKELSIQCNALIFTQNLFWNFKNSDENVGIDFITMCFIFILSVIIETVKMLWFSTFVELDIIDTYREVENTHSQYSSKLPGKTQQL